MVTVGDCVGLGKNRFPSRSADVLDEIVQVLQYFQSFSTEQIVEAIDFHQNCGVVDSNVEALFKCIFF